MANVNTLLHAPTSAEARVLERILGRKELSEARFGGQNEVFRELNRYYYSLPPQQPGRTPDQPLSEESEPDIFVPIFFTIIEQMLPVWMFQMFGNGPLGLDVLGRTEEDHERAENIQDLIYYYFQMSKVFERSVPIGKQAFKFGSGFYQVGYRYDTYDLDETWERTETAGLSDDGKIIERKVREKRTKPVVRFDGPWLEWVSVTNLHPDPLYGEIPEMRYIIKDRYTDLRRLKKEDEQNFKLTGKRLYKNLDKIPPMPQRTAEELLMGGGPELEVAEAMGWSGRRTRRFNQYVRRGGKRLDPENWIVKVTEYWSQDEEKSGDRWTQVANGSTVISDVPIPWEDKELPFGVVQCFPQEGEVWGYGLLHPIVRLQEATNSWRNMMMQNAAYNSLRSFGVAEEGDFGPSAAVFRPGELTQIPFTPDGKPLVVDLFERGSLPREAYEYEDRMISDMQRAVGSSAMIEPTAETATEAQFQRQGVVMKDRLIGALTESSYLVKLAQFFVSRSQQFFDEETSIRILGPKGPKFRKLSPQDIAGQFDYIATGSQLNPAKNVSRQQLLEAVTIGSQNPAIAGMTDWYEMWLETLKSFEGIRFPERLLNKPTEKAWPPEEENKVLDAGVDIGVDPAEPHELHVQGHLQGRMLAVQKGASEEVLSIYDQHIAEHQRYLQLSGGGAAVPPQEMPAPYAQVGPGQVPKFEEAVPSEGELSAAMGGTSRGGL